MCSGFVRAKTIYDSVNRIPDLPPDAVTPKAHMRTTATVASYGTTATPTHTVTPVVYSTLRNSYGRQIAKLVLAEVVGEAVNA